MRVHVGPGYPVYFARAGETLLLLPAGADKSSQRSDIARAKRLSKTIKEINRD